MSWACSGVRHVSPLRWWSAGEQVTLLVLPSFLASAASTMYLKNTILVRCQRPQDTFVYTRQADSDGPLAHMQSSWDRPSILVACTRTESLLSDQRQKASFLAACPPPPTAETAWWLCQLPHAVSAWDLRSVYMSLWHFH